MNCPDIGADIHPLGSCGYIWRKHYACGFYVNYPQSTTMGRDSEQAAKQRSKANHKLGEKLHQQYHGVYNEPKNSKRCKIISKKNHGRK